MKKKSFVSIFVIASVVLVVLTLSVLSFLVQTNANNKFTPEIDNQVLKPYTLSIINADYHKSYYELTSKMFREKNSFEKYKKVQEENRKEYGVLSSISPVSGIVFIEKNREKQWIYKCTLFYKASKRTFKITGDFVKENGKFKINETFFSQLTIRESSPVIF